MHGIFQRCYHGVRGQLADSNKSSFVQETDLFIMFQKGVLILTYHLF